jgi:integrase/recombinase XerD
MTDLRQRIEDYLTTRRALGFKLRGHDRMLLDFAEYLEHAGKSAVTTQLAMAWATKPASVRPSWWRVRLSVVRGFARYMHGFDSSVEVPPSDALAHRRQRPIPYIYTEAQIVDLLTIAGTMTMPLSALTYPTLFGLIAVTGLRVGEAIGLDRADVDLETGLIVVRHAKFNKSRQLPLDPSTVSALRAFAQQRDRLRPNPKASSFFVSLRGTRLDPTRVHRVFAQLVGRLNFPAHPGSGRPRIHDLRHTFAVMTLRDWYRGGFDVGSKLPLLSAYLGHVDPTTSYWYFQAVPELMAAAAERLQAPVERLA